MKRTLMSLTAALLMVSAGAAFAQEKPVSKKPAKVEPIGNATKDGKAICPIMKEEFAMKPTSVRSSYKGKTYVFCCEGCKPEFDKSPAKFVTEAKPAAKTGVKPAKKKS